MNSEAVFNYHGRDYYSPGTKIPHGANNAFFNKLSSDAGRRSESSISPNSESDESYYSTDYKSLYESANRFEVAAQSGPKNNEFVCSRLGNSRDLKEVKSDSKLHYSREIVGNGEFKYDGRINPAESTNYNSSDTHHFQQLHQQKIPTPHRSNAGAKSFIEAESIHRAERSRNKMNATMQTEHNTMQNDEDIQRKEQDRQISKKVLLQASAESTSLIEFLTGVDHHLEEEADLDQKSISYQEKLHLRRKHSVDLGSDSNYHDSEDALLFKNSIKNLEHKILDLLTSFSKCIHTRREAYQTQIKRMRDVSNAALRNAVQSEQLSASSSISRLKHSFEEDKRTFSDFMTNKLRILEGKNIKLQQEVITANEEVTRMKKEHENEAVRRTAEGVKNISTAKDAWEKEKIAQQLWLVQENKRLAADLSSQADSLNLQNKYYLDNQRHQFEDTLKSLKEEKNEFQEECIQLRNNLQELQISHAQQREELFVKISEERIEREKRFLDLRAESVEKLARVKAEAIGALHRAKGMEEKAVKELEKKTGKEREAVLLSNMLDIEKIHDAHAMDVRRLKVSLTAEHQAQLKDINRSHEQEMISLTRECSRLKRAAARGVPIYPNPSRPPLHTPSYSSFNAGKRNDNNHQEVPDIGSSSSSSSYTESTTQNSSQSSGYFDDDDDRDEFRNEGGEGRDEGEKREEECRGEYNAQSRRKKDDEFVMRKNATEFDRSKQQQININSSKSTNQKGVQGTSNSKKTNANDVNDSERLRRNTRGNVNEEEKSVVGKKGGTVISNELSDFCSFCGKYIKRIKSGSVVKNDTSVTDDCCGNHRAEVSEEEEEEEEEVMRGDDRHDCRSGGNGGTGGEEGRGSSTADAAERSLDRNRGNNVACARPASLNKNSSKSLTLNSHKDYDNDVTLNTNDPETVTTNLSIFTDFASKLKDEEILEKVQTPSEFFAYMRNKKERDEREKVEKREADERKEIEIKGNIRNNVRCLYEMNTDREMNGPTERGDHAFMKVDGKNRISTATGERHGPDREINDYSNSKGIQKTNNYNESDRNKVQVPSSSISLRMDADGTLDTSILEFQDSLVNISMDSCHEYNQNANNDNYENKKQDNIHENMKSIMQDKILTLHIDEDECHSDDSLGGLRQSASFQMSRLARIGAAECSPRLVYAVKDKEKEKEEKEKERNSSLPIAQGQGLVMGDFGSSESTVTIESALELRAMNTEIKSFSFTTDKKSESGCVLAGTVGNDFSSRPYIPLNSSPAIPPPIPSTATVMTGTSASDRNVHVNKKVTQEVFALRSALGYQSTDGSPSSDSTAAKMKGKGKGIGQGERGASLTDSCSDSEGTANSNSTGSERRIDYSRGLDLMQLANESSLDDYIGRSEKERGSEEEEREGEKKREGQNNGEGGKEGEEANKSASFKAPYRYLKSKTLRSREAEKNRSRSSSRRREYDENGENSNSRTVCRSLSPPPPPSTHTAHPTDVPPLLHGIPQAPPSSSSLPSSVGPSQPTPPRAPIDSYFNDFISPSPPSGTARPVSPSLLHSNPLSPLYSPPFPNGLPKVSLPFNSSSVEEAEKEIRRRMDSRPYSETTRGNSYQSSPIKTDVRKFSLVDWASLRQSIDGQSNESPKKSITTERENHSQDGNGTNSINQGTSLMGSTQQQRQNGKTSSDRLSSHSTAPSSSSRYNTESPTLRPPSCVPTDVIESVWNLKSPRSESSTHSSVNHSTAEDKNSNIRDTRTHDNNNTQRHTHTKTLAANKSNKIISNSDSSKYDNSNSNSGSGGSGKGGKDTASSNSIPNNNYNNNASFSLLDSSPTRNSMFRNRSRIPSFNQRVGVVSGSRNIFSSGRGGPGRPSLFHSRPPLSTPSTHSYKENASEQGVVKDVKKWDREKKECREEKEKREEEEVDEFFLHGNRFSSSTQALQDYLQREILPIDVDDLAHTQKSSTSSETSTSTSSSSVGVTEMSRTSNDDFSTNFAPSYTTGTIPFPDTKLFGQGGSSADGGLSNDSFRGDTVQLERSRKSVIHHHKGKEDIENTENIAVEDSQEEGLEGRERGKWREKRTEGEEEEEGGGFENSIIMSMSQCASVSTNTTSSSIYGSLLRTHPT